MTAAGPARRPTPTTFTERSWRSRSPKAHIAVDLAQSTALLNRRATVQMGQSVSWLTRQEAM
jgi:hypothetical protein